MNTTSHSRRLINTNCVTWIVALCVLVGALGPGVIRAQEGQRLSVTPALFEMSAEPLQEWRSSIKVVNPNQYPLTVYVEPVNFLPRGEGGDGSLVPVGEGGADGVTLAEWIEVDRAAIVLAPEETKDVPFIVRVPEGAAPGGHFAAFTVSTKPPVSTPGASQIRTAQVVTALFFVRIAGDVVEQGAIREFRAEQRFVSTPDVTFALRFQNDGNVHLRPQGDIVITNMWGQERGIIPINRQAHFGNVLPNSIRKFSFSWQGDLSLSDIGRYKAEVTLAYGQDARQFVTSSTHFWVIPLGPLVITLGSMAAILSLAIWLIRWYVRRMLSMSGYLPTPRQPMVRSKRARNDLDLAHPSTNEEQQQITNSRLSLWWTHGLRLLEALISILPRLQRATAWLRELPERQKIILGVTFLIVLLVGLGVFMKSAFESQRSYQIRYDDASRDTTVGSDEIAFESQRGNTPVPSDQEGRTGIESPQIDIVNVSGVAGAGATVALLIETMGYEVGSVTTELGVEQGRTVIVYDPSATDVALELSADLDNAPLSAFSEPASTTAPVVVYVGSDIVTTDVE